MQIGGAIAKAGSPYNGPKYEGEVEAINTSTLVSWIPTSIHPKIAMSIM